MLTALVAMLKISIHAPAKGATANTANRWPVFIYYSIFYRILQASDTYKTPKTAKNLKFGCEPSGNFVFAWDSRVTWKNIFVKPLDFCVTVYYYGDTEKR